MARPRTKSKAEAPLEQAFGLLPALKFLSLITKPIGTPNETHIYLGYGYATCFNSILSAAQAIPDQIHCCPHNSTLLQALSKCRQDYSIVLDHNKNLIIKSDKFKAIVPCVDPTTYQLSTPDGPTIEINDKLKEALEAISILASEDAQSIHLASILLNGQSIISTNGIMIMEYWHGLQLPSNLALSKTFCDVLIKSSKKLVKFGYSQSSVTIYFHDDSWIKTQLYAEQWPDVSRVLDKPSNARPLPPGFYEGLTAVQPFSPDGLIHVGKDTLASHSETSVGASYVIEGLPPGLIFSAKQLKLIEPHIQTIDWFANEGKMIAWFGKSCRGIIGGHNGSK